MLSSTMKDSTAPHLQYIIIECAPIMGKNGNYSIIFKKTVLDEGPIGLLPLL